MRAAPASECASLLEFGFFLLPRPLAAAELRSWTAGGGCLNITQAQNEGWTRISFRDRAARFAHSQASIPALCREREGRGTRWVGDGREIKSLGQPSALVVGCQKKSKFCQPPKRIGICLSCRSVQY
jgi:hypothetical protein